MEMHIFSILKLYEFYSLLV